MAKKRSKLVWIGGGALLLGLSAATLVLPSVLKSGYNSVILEESVAEVAEKELFVVTHLPTPEPVKALYMTSCVAGTPSWRNSLKSLIEATELNAVVIDIKDYSGEIIFTPGSRCFVSGLKEFIGELHEANIYVIGRISVFQDLYYSELHPELAVRSLSTGEVWKDYKNISFIDVGARPYWDYIVDISKQAYALGFDEINYDYVRYPSDGNMQDTNYTWTSASSTRAETLEGFFRYLLKNIRDVGVVTSVDLFGMTTTATHDMGIGQVLERALPYFDYISPMVYPSHYPATWSGFLNPAEYPYEVVKLAMTQGIERERAYNLSTGNFQVDEFGATTTPKSKFRPWLQDFDLGAVYGPDKVRAQIQATYDTGLTSWMLWSAANKYTREALIPEYGFVEP
jgi:hypothetical protein